MSTFYVIPSNNDLIHHGVKGQKWGVRKEPEYIPVGRHSSNTMQSNKTRIINGQNQSVSKNKKMSGKAKVAIGVAVVAAIAAGGYLAYKMKGPEIKNAAIVGKKLIESKLDNPNVDKALIRTKQGIRFVKRGKHIVAKVLAIKGGIDLGISSIQVASGKKTLDQVLRPSTTQGNKGFVKTTLGLVTGNTSTLDILSKNETVNKKLTGTINKAQIKIDNTRNKIKKKEDN